MPSGSACALHPRPRAFPQVPQPSAYRPASGASSVHVPALDTDNLSMVLDDGCGKLKRDIMVCPPPLCVLTTGHPLPAGTVGHAVVEGRGAHAHAGAHWQPQEFFLSAKSQVAEREAALVDQERREWTRMLAAKQVRLAVLRRVRGGEEGLQRGGKEGGGYCMSGQCAVSRNALLLLVVSELRHPQPPTPSVNPCNGRRNQ